MMTYKRPLMTKFKVGDRVRCNMFSVPFDGVVKATSTHMVWVEGGDGSSWPVTPSELTLLFTTLTKPDVERVYGMSEPKPCSCNITALMQEGCRCGGC